MDRKVDLIKSGEQLKGWVPIRVQWNASEPLIDWCYVGETRFTEPFFDHTVERLLQRPFNLIFRRLTAVDALRTVCTDLECVEPAGFIFHMSRCGSTLVSRMLASLPQNVVISEASALDWMIRADIRRPGISKEEQTAWIRWMVGALGQRRTADAERLFIKFDSWHTLYFDLIQNAFPAVPWIFLYREPVEILASHHKQRGAGTIPGVIEHRIPGLTLQDAVEYSAEEYPAVVLAAICRAALRQRGNANGLFVNYECLPGFAAAGMLEHFGLNYSADDKAAMMSAAEHNAKSPSVPFVRDSEQKRREAGEDLAEYADKHLAQVFSDLETISAGTLS